MGTKRYKTVYLRDMGEIATIKNRNCKIRNSILCLNKKIKLVLGIKN